MAEIDESGRRGTGHRKVYVAGLYEGFRIANEREMTPRKFKLTLDSQSAVARKVFDCVPLADKWTVHKIIGELTRTSSARVDVKTAEGILNGLTDCGLVKEVERGLFQRVTPRDTLSLPGGTPDDAPSQPEADTPVPEQSAPAPVAGIERLGDLATQLRTMAVSLMATADDLDALALGYEERIEAVEARYAKVREFAALVRNL
ncbi:hypothetical protein [Burkholderia sp. Ax-1719]|uniref:hypothetical protein n=1 Tax=Burkholderia sp. Ax-1719 TaxID=2608334 RepID=UPI00141F08C3|nr:hypothetical protein [Burkholderia sp. Ax-1719]NIE67453.1 hypothetical protein [Burkholderia sp. Ax-1719]